LQAFLFKANAENQTTKRVLPKAPLRGNPLGSTVKACKFLQTFFRFGTFYIFCLPAAVYQEWKIPASAFTSFKNYYGAHLFKTVSLPSVKQFELFVCFISSVLLTSPKRFIIQFLSKENQ
jgi:hypothetical protein